KQTWAALDGIKDFLTLNMNGPLGQMIRDLKVRAVAFLEEVVESGGYFAAVEKGFFVDSAKYPERNGDGIARDSKGGVGADTLVARDPDYFAPVCDHFGNNKLPAGVKKACDAIGGCTLCKPEKIVFIDELDAEDNVNVRLAATKDYRSGDLLKPEAEWAGDGTVLLQFVVPDTEEISREAALEMGRKLGLADPQIVNMMMMHPAEGTFVELKGKVQFDVKKSALKIPPKEIILPEEEIRDAIKKLGIHVVAATVGEDEHSVGMREIIDIKHGGIEKYGIKYTYLGTSVSINKLVDAAIETGSQAILISTIISHNDVHRENMRKLAELCKEKGIRDKVVLIAGGTQVNRDMAAETGLDATFGRGTKGIHVANAIVKTLKARGVL
ncbi:MAG TPA: OAM dimerization domain-containing protein, partial [Spirochaetales bacterium]|nr:OAM dimerization domain-containing protein [Spirochaetales bacterium]